MQRSANEIILELRRKLAVLLVLMSCPVVASAAEWTIVQPIAVIEYDGAAGDLYFAGSVAWGPASCPNVTWVRVPGTLATRKELLALALSAKSAGTPVRFYGTCANGYFETAYVKVQ